MPMAMWWLFLNESAPYKDGIRRSVQSYEAPLDAAALSSFEVPYSILFYLSHLVTSLLSVHSFHIISYHITSYLSHHITPLTSLTSCHINPITIFF